MNWRDIKWAVLALAIVTASPVFAGVSVDYDKELEFANYQTYSWGDGTPAKATFVEKRIRMAVDRELAAAGLQKVEGDADLEVITHASVETQQRINFDDFPYWHRWHRGPRWGYSTVYVQQIEVGTLIVDLVVGDELAWRAVASGAVGDPDKSEKRINKAVKKMFKRFPPQ